MQPMFSTAGLFASVPCPERTRCKRVSCMFNHAPDAKEPMIPHIPVSSPLPIPGPSNSATTTTTTIAGISSSIDASSNSQSRSMVPSKRSALSPVKSYATTPAGTSKVAKEPPRKVQRVDPGPSKAPAPAQNSSSQLVCIL